MFINKESSAVVKWLCTFLHYVYGLRYAFTTDQCDNSFKRFTLGFSHDDPEFDCS